MLCGRQLAESDSEMVGIVECVQEILVERVDLIDARKTLEHSTELFTKGPDRSIQSQRSEDPDNSFMPTLLREAGHKAGTACLKTWSPSSLSHRLKTGRASSRRGKYRMEKLLTLE